MSTNVLYAAFAGKCREKVAPQKKDPFNIFIHCRAPPTQELHFSFKHRYRPVIIPARRTHPVYLLDDPGANSQRPLLRRGVKLVQAKLHRPALVPLKVVRQRPVGDPSQVQAVLHAALNLLHVLLNVVLAVSVIAIGNARLCNVHRHIQLRHVLHGVVQPGGVGAVRHVRHVLALAAGGHKHRVVQAAGVVVDAYPVGARQLRLGVLKVSPEWVLPFECPGCEKVEDELVAVPVIQPARKVPGEGINRASALGLKPHVVVHDADLRLRTTWHGFQGAVHPRVRDEEVAEHSASLVQCQ
mmetsp:Transcript_42982/g.108764  ORF Transcript_42982/g.108764 Transcript_42982/m.108764 type:complete len:298 (-) Transcript_42982:411-1304(-)